MINELLQSETFKKLEKDYKFLSRARELLFELENESYVFFDLETTGLDPQKSEIIEVAGLKVKNKEITDIFNKLVKPSTPLPQKIKEITGITDEMLEDAKPLTDITAPLLNFIEGSILVIHNSEFDISFINHHIFTPRKLELKNDVFCSLKLSRHFLPNLGSYKLGSLADHFGITAKNSHRALGDVETLFELWFKLLSRLQEKGNVSKEDLLKISG
ncbi:MAG: DNA polymerase III subunit alpha Gram-positive type [Candidatus Saganbacteria bacterium]|uniref:DNA polymerase III subunit alpha Gram-positive type n=1 Tax=Candidatus Saganbacteria bacterium TaxID=2575572 RepID=A0A833L2K8_UNCSA|nr:MAG: DNA polymerase III subunit alpha Gram-positive type [Candidatus Saganbacteria bacterium]